MKGYLLQSAVRREYHCYTWSSGRQKTCAKRVRGERAKMGNGKTRIGDRSSSARTGVRLLRLHQLRRRSRGFERRGLLERPAHRQGQAQRRGNLRRSRHQVHQPRDDRLPDRTKHESLSRNRSKRRQLSPNRPNHQTHCQRLRDPSDRSAGDRLH